MVEADVKMKYLDRVGLHSIAEEDDYDEKLRDTIKSSISNDDIYEERLLLA